MQVPTQVVHDPPAQRWPSTSVQLAGAAYVTFTAPFYPADDPLLPHDQCTGAGSGDLDGTGALVQRELPLGLILQGTLTFQQPQVDVLTGFVGGQAWVDDLLTGLNTLASGGSGEAVFDTIELLGMFFPDGYGSFAVTLRIPAGWDDAARATTIAAVGVVGRELLAARLRQELLPPLQRLLRRCGAGDSAVAVVPYFNLTYAGSTEHPEPGRAPLDDSLRPLVYPDSASPLRSSSPWMDEYLYTGYAYHLLASRDPLPSLHKLALLLLVLNVSYARLARFAAAADGALTSREYYTDVEWLARTERRLRSEYQSLITPTFSFDHHALKVRDAVLDSWDVPKLQARADNLISMVRSAVEFRMAEDHARRVRRLNALVVILTALSVIPTADAVISLFERLG
jgi:hypothetical protein